MSVDLLDTELGDLLAPPARSSPQPTAVHPVRMLQHFQAVTSLTLGSTKCKRVVHDFVTRESWQHPHLMHMVLAISAAHLKRLHDGCFEDDVRQGYAVAEATHWAQALQHHRKTLDDRVPDLDATLATTFLSIMFSFSLDDDVPPDAYMSNENGNFQRAMRPIAAVMGFRALYAFGELAHLPS